MEIKLCKLTLFPESKGLFSESELLPKVIFEVNKEETSQSWLMVSYHSNLK